MFFFAFFDGCDIGYMSDFRDFFHNFLLAIISNLFIARIVTYFFELLSSAGSNEFYFIEFLFFNTMFLSMPEYRLVPQQVDIFKELAVCHLESLYNFPALHLRTKTQELRTKNQEPKTKN